ncbi:BAD_collapsed_G0021090.mRNA.1.CDS.1 [Saccharomyces cerevisiae]|nr:BAD_HP_G0064830.mRNA.1.CDS.1 [Saccharomyces cerevisiae]CAI6384182.1 BAD_HP_G0064830.mRNA.1.CDS.1 [Saccharomyces cerevisiae]CAI7308725.1 BAD_collapsed_G0021090.mRNA.1.CDS.1 [Saccharomyces cerevisiae]
MSYKQYFDSLPLKLKSFFQRYPPSIKYSPVSTSTKAINANPFLPNKHPVTQRFHDPKYSLRRMSDVYKLALRYGVEEFLPPIENTKKLFFEEKYNKKTLMKGVLLPKGHKHELKLNEKLKKREEALKKVDDLIASKKGSKYAKRVEKMKKNQSIGWF